MRRFAVGLALGAAFGWALYILRIQRQTAELVRSDERIEIPVRPVPAAKRPEEAAGQDVTPPAAETAAGGPMASSTAGSVAGEEVAAPEPPEAASEDMLPPREETPGTHTPADPAQAVEIDHNADVGGPTAPAEPDEVVYAYCVRCRTQRPMLIPKRVETEDGRAALRGTCPVCGTALFRFVKNQPS